jgi:hypothetical protein
LAAGEVGLEPSTVDRPHRAFEVVGDDLDQLLTA